MGGGRVMVEEGLFDKCVPHHPLPYPLRSAGDSFTARCYLVAGVILNTSSRSTAQRGLGRSPYAF